MVILSYFRSNILWRGLYLFSLLLLNIAIARCFEAAGSGWIFFTINNLHLILLITALSVESGVWYHALKNPDKSRALVTISLIWTAFASFISALFIHFFYPVPEGWTNSDFVLLITIPYFSGVLLTINFVNLFQAQNDFRTPNLVLSLVNIGLLIIIPFENNPFAFTSKDTYLNFYFFGYTIQGVIMLIAYLWRNKWVKLQVPDLATIKGVAAYALPAVLVNVVHYLLYRVDYLIVGKYCSDAELGNYIQVSKLGQLLKILPSMLGVVLFTQVAKGEKVEFWMRFLCRLIILSCFVLWVFTAAFGYYLFPFIYGTSFDNIYLPFLILLPGMAFLSIHILISNQFYGTGRIDLNLKANLLALGIMIPMDFLLIPKYGIAAAAMVSTVSYFVIMYVSFYYYNSGNRYTLSRFLLISKKDWRIFKKITRTKILR